MKYDTWLAIFSRVPDELRYAIQDLADLADVSRRTVRYYVQEGLIPPPTGLPEESRVHFRRLRALRDELDRRAEWQGRLAELSMGMSDDFEIAIEEGATYVRVGTLLFGARPAA